MAGTDYTDLGFTPTDYTPELNLEGGMLNLAEAPSGGWFDNLYSGAPAVIQPLDVSSSPSSGISMLREQEAANPSLFGETLGGVSAGTLAALDYNTPNNTYQIPEAKSLFSEIMSSDVGKTVLAAAIGAAAKGVFAMLGQEMKYDREDELLSKKWEHDDKLAADARARLAASPSAKRKAKYTPVSQSYSAPGLLNMNRGTV